MPPLTTTPPVAEQDLPALNARFAEASPQELIRWAYETFGANLAMTSSFGAQAAVMLHLATQVVPDIPVIALDTGYLFPETYRFAQELTERLNLNVHWFSPRITTAMMEAVHGRLWEQGDDGYRKYHELTKGEPMRRAVRELGVQAWIAGLRANQTEHRASLRPIELQSGIVKVHPILQWTTRDIHNYLKTHDLPYHPLYEQGYASIGDTHSTQPITAEGGNERAGRFQGLRQECGLHLPSTAEEDKSRESSGL